MQAILDEGLRQSRRTIRNYFLNSKAYVLLARDTKTQASAGFAVWLAPRGADGITAFDRPLALRYRLLKSLLTGYQALLDRLSPINLHWLLLYPSLGVSVLRRQQMWATHTETLEERYITKRNREKGYWQLSLLGVHPAFGGRGIAKRLLQFGMDKADQQDLVCYLSASPKGLPVYKKAGFEVVGSDICYPVDPQGGWTETFMMRECRSRRSQRGTK